MYLTYISLFSLFPIMSLAIFFSLKIYPQKQVSITDNLQKVYIFTKAPMIYGVFV